MRALCAAGLASILALSCESAAWGDCLDMAKVDRLHFVSPSTMIVHEKDSSNTYQVEFAHACAVQKWPNTHFVYETWTVRCLDHGSALPTNQYGTCMVKSVQRLG